MIKKETIDRINELAHKNKTVGLTEEEKIERQRLREEYLEGFRANFRQQIERIKFVEDIVEEEIEEVKEEIQEVEEELELIEEELEEEIEEELESIEEKIEEEIEEEIEREIEE